MVTDNYDTLLEETVVKSGKNFSIINSDKVILKTETINYIVKVHGDFSSDFVLKEQVKIIN
ncbi:SIR2 family protein [Clostridium botulinum]|uniref:SIR2 family protein n=1 Tax=Clostridium botulinum TaxID=1491 RepID=UPI00351E60A8